MYRRSKTDVKQSKGRQPWLSSALGLSNFVPGFFVGFLLGILVELSKGFKFGRSAFPQEKSPSSKHLIKDGKRISHSARGSRLSSRSGATDAPDGELKMVFVVRQDLKMGPGKIASQCAHAAVGSYQECISRGQRLLLKKRERVKQEQMSPFWRCYKVSGGLMDRGQRLLLKKWEDCGQPKIVVTCKNQFEMNELKTKAERANLPCFVVADAGRTQVAAGSQTVLAIGPGGKSYVDSVTRHLRLL